MYCSCRLLTFFKQNFPCKKNLLKHLTITCYPLLLVKLKLNTFPPKNKKLNNKRKHKKMWITNNQLIRINRKNDTYRGWILQQRRV